MTALKLTAMIELLRTAFQVFKPPPVMTVSQWADAERRLSPEASAEPGRWDTSRAEYQRGMMDAISDPLNHTVVVMSSAQIGKTEFINNVVGFHMHQDPAPILLIQPTLEMGEAWSKDRLAPMLRDTPALSNLVQDAKARDSGNTITHKTFPGGHITVAGANSSASLASRPVRAVLCDEVDRYPASAGTEGDPIKLAAKRSTTFWNRILILVSTPTMKGLSRIETAFEESDKRYFFVPCPDCGDHQILVWKNVTWKKDNPTSAIYSCEFCGSIWNDVVRWRAVSLGEWRATEQSKGIAGFHINEIYSPWVKLADMATEFLSAKKSPDTLKTFINTSLGETWEDQGESVDDTGLMERREPYEIAPAGVAVLTCGVDVQPDRLEYEILGHGVDGETWGMGHGIIYGDPNVLKSHVTKTSPWETLDAQVLKKLFPSDVGTDLWIKATCIDSGGHNTQAVYKFCKEREKSGGVFAIKGRAGDGPGLAGKWSRSNAANVKLFSVYVDKAKNLLFERLSIEIDGPGYCHFPMTYDADFFKQLTSEKAVKKFRAGVAYRQWVKKKAGSRNEALDCRVYAMAALEIIDIDLQLEMDRIAAKAHAVAVGATPVAAQGRRVRRQGTRV